MRKVVEGSEDLMTETAIDVTLNFSEFGQSKLLLNSPKLVRFEDENNQLIMECPIGLELIFYDSLKNVESVLVADYGKGKFIYTGLSFFRELPEGVPGAYRLFLNLISYGK